MPQPRSTKNINLDDDLEFDVPPRRPVVSQQQQIRAANQPPQTMVPQQIAQQRQQVQQTQQRVPTQVPANVPNNVPRQAPQAPASIPVPQNSTTSATKRIAEEIAKTVAQTESEYAMDDGIVPKPQAKKPRGETVKPGSLGGRTNTSKVNTIRVPVELFNLVRAEFPTARSQDVALQAYIARHSDAESMVTSEAVRQVLAEAAESSDTMETMHKELEALRASLRNLRRETAIASMGSAMVLQELYKTQNRDKRIEDWIGLSDSFMAVMNELTSLSRDYSDEVRHAAGRIQSGYGE